MFFKIRIHRIHGEITWIENFYCEGDEWKKAEEIFQKWLADKGYSQNYYSYGLEPIQ